MEINGNKAKQFPSILLYLQNPANLIKFKFNLILSSISILLEAGFMFLVITLLQVRILFFLQLVFIMGWQKSRIDQKRNCNFELTINQKCCHKKLSLVLLINHSFQLLSQLINITSLESNISFIIVIKHYYSTYC